MSLGEQEAALRKDQVSQKELRAYKGLHYSLQPKSLADGRLVKHAHQYQKLEPMLLKRRVCNV